MKGTREAWVDGIKLLACVLVVTGHFFQSMVSAGIIPETGLYRWFIFSIYCFHVPLFFICSGYLYQKRTDVRSVSAWARNIGKKLLELGIPYFTFSTITWLLKIIFSASVNIQAENLIYSLFVHPMSPYWYLYALFFLFLLVPVCPDSKTYMAIIVVAVLFKTISIFGIHTGIYPVDTVMENGIWFVLGMGMQIVRIPAVVKEKKWTVILGAVLALLFLLLSSGVCRVDGYILGVEFLLGLMACTAIVLIMIAIEGLGDRLSGWNQYTMPVFLMHTIFAAGFRSVLFKLGIGNPIIHIMCGLIISFAGPIVAAQIMKHIKWMEFFLYPGKYIRVPEPKKVKEILDNNQR